jgi:hypothetical protein
MPGRVNAGLGPLKSVRFLDTGTERRYIPCAMKDAALLEQWKTAPRVDDIMRYIQKRIDDRRRTGILYDDEIRTELGIWLTEVLADRPAYDSTLQHYMDTLGDWRLQLHPHLGTHRGRIGRIFVWIKHRLIYPPLRWIVEQVEVNAWRQDRLNLNLMRILEETVVENGRLKARVARLEQAEAERSPAPPEEKPGP